MFIDIRSNLIDNVGKLLKDILKERSLSHFLSAIEIISRVLNLQNCLHLSIDNTVVLPIIKGHKTGVINDPLSQTNSHASSEHCSLLFVLLDLKSGDGRTDRRTTCAKTMIPTGRDLGLAEWIKKQCIRRNFYIFGKEFAWKVQKHKN